jgi:DNA primase catalytic core
MLSKVSESCHYLLYNFPEAKSSKDYLDSRLSQESQDKFEFGYYPGVSNIKALTSMIGENSLKDLELIYTNNVEDAISPRKIDHSYFENYPVIMPYKDCYGKVVGLVGRTLLSEDERKILKIPKYKNTEFKKGNHVFGLFEAKESILKHDCVFIVEGQFDVIKAHENGFTNIVALGNSNMTPYQFALICRYTNNIYLLLDNDEAGKKGRTRVMSKFSSYANIKNYYIPEQYIDIDNYLSNNKISHYSEIEFVDK